MFSAVSPNTGGSLLNPICFIARICGVLKARADPIVPAFTLYIVSKPLPSVCMFVSFLRFSIPLTITLQLTYFPEPTATGAVPGPGSGYVDWTAGASFIDNLSLFHDVIALLATKQYFILDGAINEPLVFQLQKRTADLIEYLNSRNYNGAQYVSQVRITY